MVPWSCELLRNTFESQPHFAGSQLHQLQTKEFAGLVSSLHRHSGGAAQCKGYAIVMSTFAYHRSLSQPHKLLSCICRLLSAHWHAYAILTWHLSAVKHQLLRCSMINRLPE